MVSRQIPSLQPPPPGSISTSPFQLKGRRVQPPVSGIPTTAPLPRGRPLPHPSARSGGPHPPPTRVPARSPARPRPQPAPRDPALPPRPPRPRPSPEPEAPPTPRHLGQPPPAPALGRSVQAPAEPPQQRLRKTVEGRARSGERRARGRGRRRLRGRGRRGLQQLPAQRRVPRRRPRDGRGSRRPHRGPGLQRTFRSLPRRPRRRRGRGGRTNRATTHRAQRRKLCSPPGQDRFASGSRAGGARRPCRGGGASGGAAPLRAYALPRVSFALAAAARSRRRAHRGRRGGVGAEPGGSGGCSRGRKRWRSYARAAALRRGSLLRRGFPRPWEEDCLTPEREARGSPSPAPHPWSRSADSVTCVVSGGATGTRAWRPRFRL